MPLDGRHLQIASTNRSTFSGERRQRIKEHLRTFQIKHLFIEELGWDRPKHSTLSIQLAHEVFVLKPLAQKRGVAIYECGADMRGNIPNYRTRLRIDQEVTQHIYAHLIIYVDKARSSQIWQWVVREPGGKILPHEHHYSRWQDGESLLQKLQQIFVALEEEDSTTREDLLHQLDRAFTTDRITKRFFEAFKVERKKFLDFIKGIPSEDHRNWYASVMLSRLMLVYFIQKKGFLDGDEEYLPNHLERIKRQAGRNSFLSFYRAFLLRLFHEGLGKSERSIELEREFGFVPYLNGGLFEEHELEQAYPDIQIPDEAFDNIFTFFSKWQWHLDAREGGNDNEINPDVLGYIFEKLANQKEMGTYYTKEDITEYIAKSTIIPYLFDATQEKYPAPFQTHPTLWQIFQEHPDRYLYEAMNKGLALPLAEEISTGLKDASQRQIWNKPASDEYALPTETWREVIARRKHRDEIRCKLIAGEITSIHDLITYNLDICEFARDTLRKSQDAELIRHFYAVMSRMTLLDPTCGSGAFLLAALNILKPLYDICLERMAEIVEDHDRLNGSRTSDGFTLQSDTLAYFREVLYQIGRHPNQNSFVLKSIIMNNLYGVDIEQDVVEICRLRLFLKLLAQIDTVEELEPLPDVDFNIYPGNSLIGFATYDAVKRAILGAIQGKFDFNHDMERIESELLKADQLYRDFQALQVQTSPSSDLKNLTKVRLEKQLDAVNRELNAYLSREYGVEGNGKTFQQWHRNHRPFHWFVEFFEIMKSGGFDVVIGNPPYVECSRAKVDYSVKDYQSETCGNLYAYILERSLTLIKNNGMLGLITPHSLGATYRMAPTQKMLIEKVSGVYAYFSRRPGKLFEGSEQCLCIFIGTPKNGKVPGCGTNISTTYQRWYTEERANLFGKIKYAQVHLPRFWEQYSVFPKLGEQVEYDILEKVSRYKPLGNVLLSRGREFYCHRIARYFIKSTNFIPYFWSERAGIKKSEDFKIYHTADALTSTLAVAVLNSTLFYWFWRVMFDGYHCGKDNIAAFPFEPATLPLELVAEIESLVNRLMVSFVTHSTRKSAKNKGSGAIEYDTFSIKYSKPILDEIDRVLARHYDFTEGELDFIINYDIKYRMGRDASEDEEEM